MSEPDEVAYEKLISQEQFLNWKSNPHTIKALKMLENFRDESIEVAEFNADKNKDLAVIYLIASRTTKHIISKLNSPIINHK